MYPRDMIIPTGVRLALDRLDRAGYEAYIVGGCVRVPYWEKHPPTGI